MARKVFIYVIAGIIALNLAIFLWVFFSPSPAPRVMPNPNGYDDFVKAAGIVSSNDASFGPNNGVFYAQTMTREELAALVATNAEALKLIRTGLGKQCLVPVDYSTNYTSVLMPELSSVKALAMLLRAEGRLAELEKRPDDAADIYLTGVRFAVEMSRGGLLISKLVGVACESIALTPLSNVLPETSPARAGEIARALETVDEQEEPLASMFKTEALWGKRTFGIRGQIAALFTRKQMEKMQASTTAKIQAIQLRRRWAMIRYAEVAYALDHDGRTENSLAELAPKYLKAVPKDPATEKDLSLTGK